jgi:hypothetical protein
MMTASCVPLVSAVLESAREPQNAPNALPETLLVDPQEVDLTVLSCL